MEHWNEPEETLDPQDWEAMKALGHQMVDDMFDYLRTVRERPAWQPVPDTVKENLSAAAPRQGQAPGAIYRGLPKTSCRTRWGISTRASGDG